MYLGRIYESVSEIGYEERKPDIVAMLEAIGINVKDLELMDDREISIVFQNAGLNPEEYEI